MERNLSSVLFIVKSVGSGYYFGIFLLALLVPLVIVARELKQWELIVTHHIQTIALFDASNVGENSDTKSTISEDLRVNSK